LGKPVESGQPRRRTPTRPGRGADHPPGRPTTAQGHRRPPTPPALGPGLGGYGEKSVDDALRDLGVRNVVIPRKGKPSAARRAVEHRRAFRRTVKWPTCVDGRISTVKRSYGWDRTRMDGTDGARVWVGPWVLAHNLVKISTLAA
jgi:IS5 family transposase